MLTFIIWLIGLLLTIKAVVDIWKLKGDLGKRLIFYYFVAKKRMPKWVA